MYDKVFLYLVLLFRYFYWKAKILITKV